VKKKSVVCFGSEFGGGGWVEVMLVWLWGLWCERNFVHKTSRITFHGNSARAGNATPSGYAIDNLEMAKQNRRPGPNGNA